MRWTVVATAMGATLVTGSTVSAAPDITGTVRVPPHEGTSFQRLSAWWSTTEGIAYVSGAEQSRDARLTFGAGTTYYRSATGPPIQLDDFDVRFMTGSTLYGYTGQPGAITLLDIRTGERRSLPYDGSLVGGTGTGVVTRVRGSEPSTTVLRVHEPGVEPRTITTLSGAVRVESDARGVVAMYEPAGTTRTSHLVSIDLQGVTTHLATVPDYPVSALTLSDQHVAWLRRPEPTVSSQFNALQFVRRDGSSAPVWRSTGDLHELAISDQELVWQAGNGWWRAPLSADSPARQVQGEIAMHAASRRPAAGVGPDGFLFLRAARPPGLDVLHPGADEVAPYQFMPRNPAVVSSAALAGSRLLWTDKCNPLSTVTYNCLYERTLASTASGSPLLGAEAVRASGVDLYEDVWAASGARRAQMTVFSEGLSVTDGGRETRREPTGYLRGLAMSGSRLLRTGIDSTGRPLSSVLDVTTGSSVPVPTGGSLWGRYLAYVDSTGRIVRRDLDAPLSAGNPVVVRSPSPVAGCARDCQPTSANTLLAVAGHDVVYRIRGLAAHDQPVSEQAMVRISRSVRTAHAITASMDFASMAPGVLGYTAGGEAFALSLDVLAAGDEAPARLGAAYSGTRALSVDERRVAWEGSDFVLRVAPLPFAVTRPAQLLSASAPMGLITTGTDSGTWAPQFDASEPLDSWTLVLRDSAGTVVATRSGTAPEAGIRTSWDGRADGSGLPVPDGVYSWRLEGTSADGDGALRSTDGAATGTGGTVTVTRPDRRMVADFTGDGRTDIAVFRPSTRTWHLRGLPTVQWGAVGDVPVAADFTGDRKADIAVFRPSTGAWHVRGLPTIQWGAVGDVPVTADFTGDRKADVAVFRPSTRTWYVRGLPTVQWGAVGDVPVAADYTGDARSEVAVFRPSTGTWHVRGLLTGQWGVAGDSPVPADYNGDERAELAVFRSSDGMWYVRGVASVPHGIAGDVPV